MGSLICLMMTCGAWWLIGRFVAFCPKGCGFEPRSSHHIETLGKFFTHNCLRRFGGKLRHSIHAVSGAPLSRDVPDIHPVPGKCRVSHYSVLPGPGKIMGPSNKKKI